MKLIFVYNADSGRVNAAIDSLHKIVSPKTYSCSLCAVTHHPLGMIKRWAQFIENSGVETEFIHRDEAAIRFNLHNNDWPAVLREDLDGLTVWLTVEDLSEIQTIEALEALVRERLETHETRDA